MAVIVQTRDIKIRHATGTAFYADDDRFLVVEDAEGKKLALYREWLIAGIEQGDE